MEFQPAGPWKLPKREAGEASQPFVEARDFLRSRKHSFVVGEALSGCLPAIIKISTVVALAVLVTTGLKVAGVSGMASTGGGLLVLFVAGLALHGKMK